MRKTTTMRVGLAVLLIFSGVSAQTGSVAGSVTDQAGSPLVGANIVVSGTQLGASTDADGFYSITGVPAGTHTVTAT